MSTAPLVSSAEVVLIPANSMGPVARGWEQLKAKVNGRVGYALADQVVYSFGNMMVAALISRHCVQRDFGIYILTQRAMDVLIQVCNVLLWAPFTFYLPGLAQDRRSGYEGSMVGLQFVLCVVFSAALWMAARWTAVLSRHDLADTFAPLILTGGGILFREFTRRMYFAHMRFREAFWTDVATVLLQIGGTYYLLRSHRLDIRHTLLVLCAGASVVSIWWLVREWKSVRFKARGAAQDLRQNLKLGRWLLGSNMVFLASSQCNPWVLSTVLGGASVGAYAVCESVVNIPRVALTSMQNVMGPMLARSHSEDGVSGVRRAVKRFDRNLLVVSAGFALAICCAGPFLARLIFKTAPTNARTVLVFLSLNLMAYTATLAKSYGLTVIGRVDTTFYANAIGFLAQAALSVFLVRRFHVSGAAAALLIGSVLVWGVRQVTFRQAVEDA